MDSFCSWIASFLYKYGLLGAGMASFHGGHEPAVPSALQELCSKKKWLVK